MRTVFLDTVGLLALWDRSDQWHQAADAAYQQLSAAPVRLVTSTLVLFECGNAAARRPYRADVFDLWAALEASGDLLRPTDGQVGRAWAAFAGQPPGAAGIAEAFTNDAYFRAAGFVTLF